MGASLLNLVRGVALGGRGEASPPELNSHLAPFGWLPGHRRVWRALPSSLPVKRARAPRAAQRPGWSGRGQPSTGQLLGGGQRGNGARRPGPVGSICSSQDFAFVQSEIMRD